MKKILLLVAVSLGSLSAKAQCAVGVNDSLISPSFDYVLNAVNQVGVAPFTYTWTFTDGNNIPIIPIFTSADGDSVRLDILQLQQAYGCISYRLCMTDANGCSTCGPNGNTDSTAIDTSFVQVPFNCLSTFSAQIVQNNTIQLALVNQIPQFLYLQVGYNWTNGDGTPGSFGGPANNPVIINYIPGAQNTSNKVFICAFMNLQTGGCLHCDSVQYTNAAADLSDLSSNFNISIAPNPAVDFVQVSAPTEVSQFELVSSNGMSVAKGEPQSRNFTLDIVALPKGVYFLKAITNEGILIKKIVVSTK
jgi:Secretion system C-terminal sorting domain